MSRSLACNRRVLLSTLSAYRPHNKLIHLNRNLRNGFAQRASLTIDARPDEVAREAPAINNDDLADYGVARQQQSPVEQPTPYFPEKTAAFVQEQLQSILQTHTAADLESLPEPTRSRLKRLLRSIRVSLESPSGHTTLSYSPDQQRYQSIVVDEQVRKVFVWATGSGHSGDEYGTPSRERARSLHDRRPKLDKDGARLIHQSKLERNKPITDETLQKIRKMLQKGNNLLWKQRKKIAHVPKHDPAAELKNFQGPHDLPELQNVHSGHITLRDARRLRFNKLASMFDLKIVKNVLTKEDMLGSEEEFENNVQSFEKWRNRRRRKWAEAREAVAENDAINLHSEEAYDPTIQMVYPREVLGKRMGPPQTEEELSQWKQLVREHEIQRKVQSEHAKERARARLHAQPAGYSVGMLHTGRSFVQQVRTYSTAVASRSADKVEPNLSVSGSGLEPNQSAGLQPRPKSKSGSQSPSKAVESGQNAKQSSRRSKPNKPSRRSKTSNRSSQPSKPSTSPTESKPPVPGWRIQQKVLAAKFPSESGGWDPRRKLSPDAILHIQHLHNSDPAFYTTPLLASTFKMSPEAIRRVLKSKWLSKAGPEEMARRRERWARRHDRIWDLQAEMGLKPRRRKDKKVEDAAEAAERIEREREAQDLLRRAREENPLWGENGG